MKGQEAIPIVEGTLCERCRSKPAVHTHHRKRRSQGGDDRNENLVSLCLLCHQWIHDHPKDAAAAGWLVLSFDDPALIPTVPIDIGREHDHLTPGQVCPACGRKVPKLKEEQEAPRERATISMKVPMDQRENGVELWYEMIQIGRDMLCKRMGWEENVPMYNVAMVLVAQGLEVARQDTFAAEELADA